jgi:AraC-like DNA-binding protein
MLAQNRKAKFESIPTSEGESFIAREFSVPSFDAPWHFHPEIEITHILKGVGQRFVGDHIGDFAAGDLVLLGGGVPHFWRSESGVGGARSRVVQFRSELLEGALLGAPELDAVSALLGRAARGIRFESAVGDNVSERMRALIGARGASRFGELLNLLGTLAERADYEVLASTEFDPKLDTSAAERIGRCHRYVFDNLEEVIDLRSAAAAAGMQANAFSRYFRQVTGKTFSRFVNEVRVGHACRLLLEGDRQIADICFSCGFCNLSNFNRRFHEIKGCSPRQFRARFCRGLAESRCFRLTSRE